MAELGRLKGSPSRAYLAGLKVLMGLCWTLTYLLIIRRGFADQTVGMPLVSLATNISWEFIFAFVYPHGKTQRAVNAAWFCLDLVILWQLFQFGNTVGLPDALFYLFVISALVTAYALTLLVTRHFQDWRGQYTAFGGNLLMSVLFITMLLDRGNLAGQSLYIALFKLLGTAISALAFYRYYPVPRIIHWLSLAIFIFDVIYLVMVYQQSIELGLSVWGRF
ncbi:MAG: hypothetical protein KJ077_25495 [Anaerolineae bacterium]|nr:hypothetical protein [Anaerolineae bacterium]